MKGTKVQVYFNLHKKCFSVRSVKTKKVIAHVNNISLKEVKLKVNKAGRLRVLKDKQKNVHAFIEGIIIEDCSGFIEVTYNPYRFDSFVTHEGLNPVYTAKNCTMTVKNKIPNVKIVFDSLHKN